MENIVETITTDRERWVEEMMREELGIQEERITPLMSGLVTFTTFILAGFFPVFPYVLAFIKPALVASAFMLSIGITAVALFCAGGARRIMTRRPWWQSGLEFLRIETVHLLGADSPSPSAKPPSRCMMGTTLR